MGDGGVPGYSTTQFVASKDKEGNTTARICGTKGRVSKRTIPAHEALSRVLQGEETKKLATVLSHRPELANAKLQVVLAGDSICVASLFNPKVEMRNVLLRSAILSCKDKCLDIMKLFPKAEIQLCWLDG